MTRILVLALLLAGACRRHHEAPAYESDTRAPAVANEPAGSPTAGAAPTATPGNPLGEPVLPRREGEPPAGMVGVGTDQRAANARMPDGGTINGDPRGPRAAEFNRIVDAAMPALRECFDRADLPAGNVAVTIHYAVEPPGYTGAVTVKAEAPQAVLDCCRRVIEALKFPPFRGAKVEQELPFTYWKKEVRTGGPDAALKQP
jgi:hypothetical protein